MLRRQLHWQACKARSAGRSGLQRCYFCRCQLCKGDQRDWIADRRNGWNAWDIAVQGHTASGIVACTCTDWVFAVGQENSGYWSLVIRNWRSWQLVESECQWKRSRSKMCAISQHHSQQRFCCEDDQNKIGDNYFDHQFTVTFLRCTCKIILA